MNELWGDTVVDLETGVSPINSVVLNASESGMYKNRNKYQTQATECTEWSNRGDSMATADTPTIPIGEYANIVAAEAAEARVVPASDALDNLRSDSVPSIGREEISKKKKRPSDKKATKKHCNKLST